MRRKRRTNRCAFDQLYGNAYDQWESIILHTVYFERHEKPAEKLAHSANSKNMKIYRYVKRI